MLEYTDEGLIKQAQEVDNVLGLDVARVTQRDIKKQNKKENRERQLANIEKRKALEEQRKAKRKDRSPSNERSKKQKAQISAENAGFEGVGQGALAVAV